eukprot:1138547-Pelagomonas_calceolata.AAC.5
MPCCVSSKPLLQVSSPDTPPDCSKSSFLCSAPSQSKAAACDLSAATSTVCTARSACTALFPWYRTLPTACSTAFPRSHACSTAVSSGAAAAANFSWPSPLALTPLADLPMPSATPDVAPGRRPSFPVAAAQRSTASAEVPPLEQISVNAPHKAACRGPQPVLWGAGQAVALQVAQQAQCGH